MTAHQAIVRRELDDLRPLQAVRIPLGKLRVHPLHIRNDMGDLSELARSLATEGQHQLIEVERRGDHFVIHEGHRRFGAAVIAGLRSLKAEVVPPRSDAEAVATMLTTSVHVRRLSPGEQRKAVRYLVDVQRMSIIDVAARCGVSDQTVRRWYHAEPTTDRAADSPADQADPAGLADAEAAPRSASCSTPLRHRKQRRRTTVGVVSLRDLVDRWTPRCGEGLDGDQAADLLAEIRALLTPEVTDGAPAADAAVGPVVEQGTGERA